MKLDKVDALAVLETNDRFLPVSSAPKVGTTLTALFAAVVTSVNGSHFSSEDGLNSLLDLELVSTAIDLKDVGISGLLKQSAFLGEFNRLNDAVDIFHRS